MREVWQQNETQVQGMSPEDAQWLHLVYRSIYRLQLQSCWTDVNKIMRISIPNLPGAYLSLFCLNLPDTGKFDRRLQLMWKQPGDFLPCLSLHWCTKVWYSGTPQDRLSQSSTALTKDKFLLSQGPEKAPKDTGSFPALFYINALFHQQHWNIFKVAPSFNDMV